MYLGSWRINDFVTFSVNTHMASTGNETDADSAPTYRIYEDETGTPIVTGSMAKLDDAGTTGFYSERVQLLAASGFEKGKTYTVRVTATVSTVVASKVMMFQVEAAVDVRQLYLIPASDYEADAPFRSLGGAVSSLVNRVDTQSGALQIFKQDDLTVYGTKTLTTDPNADPIVGADTV